MGRSVLRFVGIIVLFCGIMFGGIGLPHTLASLHAFPSSKLILQLSDLPAGFTTKTARSMTDTEIIAQSHMSIAAARRAGSLGGYTVEYDRSALVGIVEISAELFVRTTSASAHHFYSVSIPRLLQTPMSVGHIGDESVGRTVTQISSTKISVTGDEVWFRRKNYDALVTVIGLTGTFPADQVAQLAHIMDNRIKTHGD